MSLFDEENPSKFRVGVEETEKRDSIYEGNWSDLPDNLLYFIFQSLKVKDLLNCSLVCRRWNDMAQNNSLWNKFFIRDFFLNRSRKKKVPGAFRERNEDWKKRYLKNIYTVPRVNVGVLRAHEDEVLHVCFSNDGHYFVTCSKDCRAIIWRTKDMEVAESHNMVRYNWAFTWASQFSPSDKRLLISGVINEIGGELVVMERSKVAPHYFQMLCRVINDPFDVNGCWWSDRYFISGTIISGLNEQFQASIWLCEPPDIEMVDNDSYSDERRHLESLISINCYKYCLFKYQSIHVAYLRNIMSACLRQIKSIISSIPLENETNLKECVDSNILKILEDESEEHVLVFMCSDMTSIPHKIGLYKLTPERFSFTPIISSPDASVELNGHTVGLNMSKDRRYLYVNVRSWPENSLLSTQELPAISSEIEMKVIDMETFDLVEDLTFYGHRAFTSSDSAFYLYLDTSASFITSGSENAKGLIWERSTGIKLSELVHEACVNSVVFHPKDEELCISVSDDKTIKVWTSLNRFKTSSSFDEFTMNQCYSQAIEHKF